MPYLWALAQDRNFSCTMDVMKLPDASNKDSQAAPRPWSADSVFIMLSAKAYSSVGFGLVSKCVTFVLIVPFNLGL